MSKTETQEFNVYKGQENIIFYPNSHRYKWARTGEWLPSPSSIVGKLDKSRGLMKWAVSQCTERVRELMRDGKEFNRDDLLCMLEEGERAYTEERDSKATIGSIVHDYAEKFLTMDELTRDDELKIELIEGYSLLSPEEQELATLSSQAFAKWFEEHDIESLDSEFVVFSKRHKYAGRCDGLIQIGKEQYIIDFKTSKYVYPEHVYQISSYLKAYEEETGEKLAGAIVVKLGRDGEFDTLELSRSDLVKAFKGFKNLLSIYRIDKEITKLTYGK